MERSFWKRLLDAKDPLSIKRFITLVVSFHFLVASFATLFVAFYLIFYLHKGEIDINLLGLLKDILWDDFMIIGGGIGFITVDSWGQVMVEKAKALASVVPTVKADNVENVNVITNQ